MSEVTEVIENKKEFICSQCELKVVYNYFGKKPPFAKSIM